MQSGKVKKMWWWLREIKSSVSWLAALQVAQVALRLSRNCDARPGNRTVYECNASSNLRCWCINTAEHYHIRPTVRSSKSHRMIDSAYENETNIALRTRLDYLTSSFRVDTSSLARTNRRLHTANGRLSLSRSTCRHLLDYTPGRVDRWTPVQWDTPVLFYPRGSPEAWGRVTYPYSEESSYMWVMVLPSSGWRGIKRFVQGSVE